MSSGGMVFLLAHNSLSRDQTHGPWSNTILVNSSFIQSVPPDLTSLNSNCSFVTNINFFSDAPYIPALCKQTIITVQ
ncbi:Putative aminotransferase class III superfamily protein [Zea mays]|uniref:Putative aminotransferase class III superfamily protein n=1 Tax=Zea mays TaxID=4577 RepID=A0A1D6M6H0_MAIZE|nr:Putative aminotransferase class III superfamily protein [Zea mays]AQK86680.1 Putative aminotransferase class III superfamily protein [Zea mays]